MARTTRTSRFGEWPPGHITSVMRVLRTNRTARAVVAAMALFAVVAAIWAAVGYVYADDRKAASATTLGLCVLAVGWIAVLTAVTVKFTRLRARRRAGNSED